MAYPAASARSKNWGTEILTDTDLESELDLLHDYINDALNSSTGHKHDGTTSEGPKILTANINDSAGTAGDVLYSSGTALSRLAIGTAAQLLAVNSGATAPEWVALTWDDLPDGFVVQVVNTQNGTVSSASPSAAMSDDDDIPQNTEGNEVMTLAITPKATTNKLKIDVVVHMASNGGGGFESVAALFQDSTANALASARTDTVNTSRMTQIKFTHYMNAGTTSSTTFKVRIGTPVASDTLTFNGEAGSQKLGGTLASSITITEIKAS